MIIGITGGTGSGKTTLLNIIRDKGGLVLDCDAIYHRLLQEDTAMLTALQRRFPEAFNGGVLDRKKLGSMVFADEKALLDLNAITHAAVKKEVQRCLEENQGLAAIDAIGLFEGELAALCDVTVAVCAPRQQRIARLMAREGISEAYAKKRIDAQHKDAWFRERCDYTLENAGEMDAFATKCLAFLQGLGIM